MIFVTLGNATQGFLRLLEGVDRLAHEGFFGEEEVFMQTGHNDSFRSSVCRCQPFLSMDEFQRCLANSSLVITHGGCTVFQVLRVGKIPVVLPRARRYGEHVNDHQVAFVKALAQEDRVIPAYEPGDLRAAVEEARRRRPGTWPPSRMPGLITQAIGELLRTEPA